MINYAQKYKKYGVRPRSTAAGAAKAGVDSNGVKIIAGNDDDASVTASVLDNKIKDDITALFNKIKKK